MTPTERAKRSDALYYETVSVNRRVLCDMIANRESDLEDARAENAKLRELVRLMWKPFCWAQSGYEVCLTDEQETEIRDMARELGIEEDG